MRILLTCVVIYSHTAAKPFDSRSRYFRAAADRDFAKIGQSSQKRNACVGDELAAFKGEFLERLNSAQHLQAAIRDQGVTGMILLQVWHPYDMTRRDVGSVAAIHQN